MPRKQPPKLEISPVVQDYLRDAGTLEALASLGRLNAQVAEWARKADNGRPVPLDGLLVAAIELSKAWLALNDFAHVGDDDIDRRKDAEAALGRSPAMILRALSTLTGPRAGFQPLVRSHVQPIEALLKEALEAGVQMDPDK